MGEGKIIRHLPNDVLYVVLKKCKKTTRLLKKVRFVLLLYRGIEIADAARIIGISKTTGYTWLRLWNRNGILFLAERKRGRKPKIRKIEYYDIPFVEGSSNISKIKEALFNDYGIKYSERQLRRMVNVMKFEDLIRKL